MSDVYRIYQLTVRDDEHTVEYVEGTRGEAEARAWELAHAQPGHPLDIHVENVMEVQRRRNAEDKHWVRRSDGSMHRID